MLSRFRKMSVFTTCRLQWFSQRNSQIMHIMKCRFSQNNKKDKIQSNQSIQQTSPQSVQGKKQDLNFSQQQKQMINSYKNDQFWNIIIQKDKDFNLQRQLIVTKKLYERKTKQLRNAILFEDLLKSQLNIPIYDTKGKVWISRFLKFLFMLSVVFGSLYSIYDLTFWNPQSKVIFQRTTAGKFIYYAVLSMSAFLFLTVVLRHRRFSKRFVEKIVYNTQTQKFTFVRRNFFGFKRTEQISRYKIVYTESPFLNKLGTNYFHLDTKQQYSISFKDFWIKEDLFSHLIAQRIKI